MQISINQIAIKDRIRKDYGDINELAADIKENGLINPPVITPDYTLIAGERRIKACQLLGWTEIEVRVMEVRDYEHQLKLEISENETRKELTVTERLAYAREIERIEAAKAAERRRSTQNNNAAKADRCLGATQEQVGRTRDIVAKTVGFGSRRTYERAEFIAQNASPETIAKIDASEISIKKAFEELKQKEGTTPKRHRIEDIVAQTVGYGSGRTYREAKFVVENGRPELVAKLDAGEISVHKAYKEAKQQTANSAPVPTESKPKRDPFFKPYVYTPDPHVEAPVLQKMLEDINMEIMLFFGKFTDELYKLEILGDFEYTIGAYVDAFRKHGNNLDSLIQIKKGLEKDARKVRKSAY